MFRGLHITTYGAVAGQAPRYPRRGAALMRAASPTLHTSPIEVDPSEHSPDGMPGRRRRTASFRQGKEQNSCDGSSGMEIFPSPSKKILGMSVRPVANRSLPAHEAPPPLPGIQQIASNESKSGATGVVGSQPQSRPESRNSRYSTDSGFSTKSVRGTRGTCREPVLGAGLAIMARQVAYEYNIGSAISVLFSYKGTFWPHVLRTHELYLYPLLHTGLVLMQWSWQQQANDLVDGVDSGRGTFWSTVFEVTADDGVDVGPKQYWEKSNMMIPWKAVGTLTPLMVFALVFFLSQCYSRFMTFFYACQLMETAIQDMTVLMLVHAKRHKHRWDAVRYLTAAAMTTYGRVTDLANVDENKRRCKPSMDLIDWERLLLPERKWHAAYVSDEETWDTILGWPREAGAVEVRHTEELHASFGTSATPPPRASSCPALLKVHEVDELRHYPDSMVGLVLVTWCVQTLKELELNGQLKGPSLGQAQGEPPNLPHAPLRHPSPQPHVPSHTCQAPFSPATRARNPLCARIRSQAASSFVQDLQPAEPAYTAALLPHACGAAERLLRHHVVVAAVVRLLPHPHCPLLRRPRHGWPARGSRGPVEPVRQG